MAERLTGSQLKAIMQANGVSRIWSWSKVDKFIVSPFEYYLKYIAKKPEDRLDCAYANLGGVCHDIIEKLYSGVIEYGNMPRLFDTGWMAAIDIADLRFDRNDAQKNEAIQQKYYRNLTHFFAHHTPIKHKILLEKFVTAKIGKNLFQGYIDAVYKDDDGIFHIVDWKTSTKYVGKTAEEKCGQLIIYAIALHQAGIPWEKIKICWNFLKYCTVQYEQKNGAVKTRDVERCKLGESLQSNARVWLNACGYQEEADEYLKALLDANSIEALPEEVQSKYVISDCYTYVPITDKLLRYWVNTIVTTIEDIELREKDYQSSGSYMAFWDKEDQVKAQSYYFATLCGYSANLHLPYKQYLEKLEAQQNGEDLFGGVGVNVQKEDCASSVAPCSASPTVSADPDDLSWLSELMA